MGWAMAVHTRPRNDGVLVNESTGETTDNAGWTQQRWLKGKLGPLRAAALAPNAWSAPQRRRNKLGLFGMLGRLGLALSAAAVVGFLAIGRFSPLWHTGGNGTATVAAELRLPFETAAERQSIPVERPPATAGTRIAGNQPAESNDSQTSEKWDEQTQQELFKTSVVPESSANQPETQGETAETLPGAARNPLNHADALWIQKRLHDLGYYFSHADGVWGASSRSALRDFKTINGLQENDTWDKETEEQLSFGQNIHPSNIFIGRWAVDFVQCRQLQDGSAPITINSHRAETADSACNFRSVKREGTNSWRIRALCSADGNSWNANIRLKLIGSKLSWSSERGTETYVRCPGQMDPAMTRARDGTRVDIGSR